MRYGIRSKVETSVWILAILFTTLAAAGGTLPKGVLPAPPAAPIAVRLTTDKPTYAPGEEIRITIEVDKPCYLYLYDIDPAGAVSLLFPNRFQPDPHFGPGKLTLPGKGYHFVVRGPEGEETLVAVAATAPIPMLKLKDEKAAFRSFKLSPKAFVEGLESELKENEYSTAWSRIRVYQPKAILLIDSAPEGAEIYIGDDYVGETPKELTLPAAETTITLKKDGFLPYSRTIDLTDKAVAEISARLEEVPHQPPTEEAASPVSGFLAVDIGQDSIGGEIGLARSFGIYLGARFLNDPTLAGPEWGIGVRLHIRAAENVRVLLGGGIALQERYLVPPVGVPTPQKIVIEPETETALFPDILLGLELDLRYGLLFGGYDLRRGAIIGIGISFGG